MDNELILEERITRIRKAVSFAKPDRVPVILEYAGFAAYVTNTSMADFISSPARATQTMIKAFHCVGGGDGINYGSFSAHSLSYSFGAKVRLPGFILQSGCDIPANAKLENVKAMVAAATGK